jgi:hypothetical protein
MKVEVGEMKVELGASPLTDPRALLISIALNAALLVATSLIVLRAVRPQEESIINRVLSGSVEPIDNRAAVENPGGSPGELGGVGVELSSDVRRPVAPTREPAADALLAEVLTTRSAAESTPRALPGPATTGLGVVPGLGAGGGGGAGTGSQGGVGSGIGPGTEFFGLRDNAASYAYVIDCSGSMDTRAGRLKGRNVLDVAKAELLSSLNPLPAEAKFGVIFYNLNAMIFTDPSGHREMMPASEPNKVRMRSQLADVQAVGGTDHMKALRAALKWKPEVIFFLTDADLMSHNDVELIRREAGKTRIFAVEFGTGPSIKGSEPLRALTDKTGGSYRYIDVRSIGEAAR